MDADALSRELMRALRGSRSREAFARRLGCSANAVYSWETGRREPPADVFFRAADRSGVDVAAALGKWLRSDPGWLAATPPGDERLAALLVREARGAMGVGELAAGAGLSRFVLARWSSGSAVPRLPDLLRVLHAATRRGLDFCACFVDPAELPSARDEWARMEAARQLAVSHPWAQVVAEHLQLDAYRALPAHDDAWIAGRTGLTEEEVRGCLALLESAGAVERRGARWVPAPVAVVEVLGPEAKRATRAWGARVAAKHIESGGPGRFNWSLFAVSAEDRERLEALHQEYVAALRAIVSEGRGGDHVLMANVHLFEIGPWSR